MEKEKILISSCLLGELVKYNGSHNLLEKSIIDNLQSKYHLYPFCPEIEGGLPIPRIPCEIISTNPIKIINKEKDDKTKEFILGAKKALLICKKNKIKKAILKSNSPSCSNKYTYDGTFSGKKVIRKGVTTQLLDDNGIEVYDENDLLHLSYTHK